MPVEIDENTLKQIAGMTGGAYFRATDSESLDRILKEIDELEKTKIEVQHFVRYKELFPIFIIIGLCLLLADMLLRNTIFRKLP
jgi:Ca-activated chloride channel family protein